MSRVKTVTPRDGLRCTQRHNAPHSLCRNVVPIAALFSGTLWLGNAAYLYLSVAFIQMLKVSCYAAGIHGRTR